MYYDWTIIFVLPALILSLLAQLWVKRVYSKYSKIMTEKEIPAWKAVQKILYDNGLNGVSVTRNEGLLSDHFDPVKQVLSLSEGVYDSSSVAALGIAAHEAGHALQQRDGYSPLILRNISVSFVNIGSNLSIPLFILGMVFSFKPLLYVGIGLFSLTVLFSLITLPVEFDASRRAIRLLRADGAITPREEKGVKTMLTAAAMTYVAQALMSLLQLLRLVILSKSRTDRD